MQQQTDSDVFKLPFCLCWLQLSVKVICHSDIGVLSSKCSLQLHSDMTAHLRWERQRPCNISQRVQMRDNSCELKMLWYEGRRPFIVLSRAASLMDFKHWYCSWSLDKRLFPCFSQSSHWYILIMIMNQSPYQVIRECILFVLYSSQALNDRMLSWDSCSIPLLAPLEYVKRLFFSGYWFITHEVEIKGFQTFCHRKL